MLPPKFPSLPEPSPALDATDERPFPALIAASATGQHDTDAASARALPRTQAALAATLDGMSLDEGPQVALDLTMEGANFSLTSARHSALTYPVRDWERYEFLGSLGRGGMGTVYRARDRRLGRMVALKFIRSDDEHLTARFVQEARAQSRLNHPNICKVYETGEVEGKAYIAMELVEGVSLDHAQRDLSIWDRVQIIRDVASALHTAHELGIIHREISQPKKRREIEILGRAGKGPEIAFMSRVRPQAHRELQQKAQTECVALVGMSGQIADQDPRLVDTKLTLADLGFPDGLHRGKGVLSQTALRGPPAEKRVHIARFLPRVRQLRWQSTRGSRPGVMGVDHGVALLCYHARIPQKGNGTCRCAREIKATTLSSCSRSSINSDSSWKKTAFSAPTRTMPSSRCRRSLVTTSTEPQGRRRAG